MLREGKKEEEKMIYMRCPNCGKNIPIIIPFPKRNEKRDCPYCKAELYPIMKEKSLIGFKRYAETVE